MTTAAMGAALRWLPHAGWQAALLGALVLLVSWALRGRLEARWRFALWWVVLARLALPVAPAAPWSLFQLARLGGGIDAPGGAGPTRSGFCGFRRSAFRRAGRAGRRGSTRRRAG